ncbi:MAG: YIP1 family protein [Holophagaceae bacterium]|uniref:YIP1 family protein n=1 Tax=Candidatus Geothrix skivensis TaxID=2954439 RepID=A0A9D7SCR3_9BACT|nr:YIP1 family protein [Candidatus Geothrix skivensis]
MNDQSPSLYGSQPEAPRPQAPGLLEQILGVFTSPVELFQRLNKAPSWGWALGLIVACALILTVIWGLKVDVDEMLRPILERNPDVSSGQIDLIIGMQKKFILPFGILGALFGTAAAMAILGLFYWLIGKALPEAEAPTYPQALSAAVVPSLVKLPHMLLIAIICLVRPVGGLTPDKIAPTSLGYFLQVESLKLQAFLYTMDLFYLAEALLAYLALRYLVRMKTLGALICVLLPMALGIGLRVFGAK